MIVASYEDALVTFRNLLDDGVDHAEYSEYVRGGVNLIADLFGVVGTDVTTRMDQVMDDLRRLPFGARPTQLHQYGVAPYIHDPEYRLGITN